MATYLGIIGGLGAAGASAYAAASQPQGGGGDQQTRVGVPYATGGQSYLARLLALNADQTPTSFGDFVKSGGTASFQMKGAGSFTPLEAQRLGMVGVDNAPVPWFDPTAQNRLNEDQALFIGADRASRRRQGRLDGPLTPEEQLYEANSAVMQGERFLRRGKVGARRAIRIAKNLDANRKRQELLRNQLFGAPGQNGTTPGSSPTDPTGRDF